MRLFYLINEPFLNYQSGYRNAINKLVSENQIESVFYYSFYVRLKELNGDWEALLEDLSTEVLSFRPTVILFAHTSNKPFHNTFFAKIETQLGFKPVYALDERDVYGKFAKRLPKQLLALSAKCDYTFLVTSGGWMYDAFKRSTKGKLIYLPHVCDEELFKNILPSASSKKYDVIMIGNLAKSRIPFKSMPGVMERIEVAKKLYNRYGNRFAVFGNGWEKYPFSAGPVSFFEQDSVLKESDLSVGVDHFLSYRQYFSDRLPIALYSQIPHLTFATPDIDLLFKEEEHIFYFNSVNQVVNKTDYILSGKVKNMDYIINNAKKLIQEKYTEQVRMQTLVNFLKG